MPPQGCCGHRTHRWFTLLGILWPLMATSSHHLQPPSTAQSEWGLLWASSGETRTPCIKDRGGAVQKKVKTQAELLQVSPPSADLGSANTAPSRSDQFVFFPLTINPISLQMGK